VNLLSARGPGRRTRTALTALGALAVVAAGQVVPATSASAASSASAATCPAAGGVAVPLAAQPASGPLVVQGHGYGHSLGMSQYGAEGAARLGCTAATILSTYYPGTTQATRTLRPTVSLTLMSNQSSGRVSVQAQTGALAWRAPNGVTVTQPAGATWVAQRRSDGNGTVVTDGAAQRMWVAASDPVTVLEQGVVARVRALGGSSGTSTITDLRMRWDRTVITGGRGLSAVQQMSDDAHGLGVQKYLWGVSESPFSWPAAALQAQAIAARTYLANGYADPADSGGYRIGTTASTQNYDGFTAEQSDATQAGGGWRRAVDVTLGRVEVDASGALIDALFTSSHGGRSEDERFVWGGPGTPYLVSVDDSRWDAASDNPYRSWAQGFSSADLAARFGLTTVTGVSVGAPGTTARLAGITVTGTVGSSPTSRTYTAWQMRAILGLLSPSVTFRWITPPAPPTTPAPAPVTPAAGQPLSGDFDGDGRPDLGWYAAGRVSLRLATGARIRYAFGAPGDRAVVGDWNGDGKDSVAVVHRGVWCLRNALSSGPCSARFSYGGPADQPVAGRWRGGRVDGIGIVRDGRWRLRLTPTGGPAQIALTWGGKGDQFVTGDWNGDGTDSQGVVRAGGWMLANRLATGARHDVAFRYGAPGQRVLVGAGARGARVVPGVVSGATFSLGGSLSGGAPTTVVTFAP
jgi:stage II sporulation protein D